MSRDDSFLDILIDTFRVYLFAPVGFVLIALPAVLGLALVMIGADLALGLAEHLTRFFGGLGVHAGAPGADPADILSRVGIYLAACTLGALVLGPLAVGALIVAAGQAMRGRRPAVGDCYAAALPRLPHLLATCLLLVLGPLAVVAGFTAVALLTGVRFVLLSQFANVMVLRFALAPCAIVLDGENAISGLQRSWQVSSRRYLALAGLVVVFAAVVLLPVLVMAGAPAGLTTDLSVTFRVGEALGALTAAVLSPLAAIVLALAYLRWTAALVPQPHQYPVGAGR